MNAGTSLSVARSSPRQNRILAALPAEDFERLLPHLEFEPLPLSRSIYEDGDVQRHALFPIEGIVSRLHVMRDGSSVEIAVVGNEGAIGVALFMGGGAEAGRAVVQSEGFAYRLKASVLMNEFRRGGTLQRCLLRYANALMAQMAQTAACNRHHSIDQQFCRWLLLSLDRLPANELAMTQELIANMLGVRREGVSEAAGKLQADGLIHYSRGRIRVLDRPKLEARVCECYAVVRAQYDPLNLDARAGPARADEPTPNPAGEYLGLAAAAAAIFYAVHRMTADNLQRRDYDEALNLAAAAYSRVAPVYVLDDQRQGQVALPLDLTGPRFSNGATEVHGLDGRRFTGLSVRHADMLAA